MDTGPLSVPHPSLCAVGLSSLSGGQVLDSGVAQARLQT